MRLVMPEGFMTAAGLVEHGTVEGGSHLSGPVEVPLPISPDSFAPQHRMVPPAMRAQAKFSPAAMPVAPERFGTGVAVFELVSVPLPSWAKWLSPQQSTAPPAAMAQLWL